MDHRSGAAYSRAEAFFEAEGCHGAVQVHMFLLMGAHPPHSATMCAFPVAGADRCGRLLAQASEAHESLGQARVGKGSSSSAQPVVLAIGRDQVAEGVRGHLGGAAHLQERSVRRRSVRRG